MNRLPEINSEIRDSEVPDLREAVGWARRDRDYPALFGCCTFWAAIRNEKGLLIGFGYVAGTGLEHGYMEDILIHPFYQKQGLGKQLVSALLQEAERTGLEIVTVTFAYDHKDFYRSSGFDSCAGGVWRKSV
ncbi:GNAT family N-acetyltransferase [Jeotgalibacillus campisalis]|uniref:GNAT family acetyltransferase n=1 Tax=Jeotgalibacillus campisalis TaxID=220754 RepID=A0A0C2RXA5_9BACL|nr:GNAT family N-acetyltransferase [Jeotgalibacillus campisalis]KIL46379.1 GNAT family acetyltransferase [Jeotgalibacillus campisalis]